MGPDLEKTDDYNNDAGSEAPTEANDLSPNDSATEVGDWSDDEAENQDQPPLRRQNAQIELLRYSVFEPYHPDPRPAENPNAERLARPQRSRAHGAVIWPQNEDKEEKYNEFKR